MPGHLCVPTYLTLQVAMIYLAAVIRNHFGISHAVHGVMMSGNPKTGSQNSHGTQLLLLWTALCILPRYFAG